MVEEFLPPGPSTLVIAEWQGSDGEIVNGEVGVAAEEGIEGVISHVEDEGPTDEGDTPALADGGEPSVRSVVADAFDVVSEEIVGYLRTAEDRVATLNTAVEAIEESDEVSTRDDYGMIAFINMPYRYRLTKKSVELHQK